MTMPKKKCRCEKQDPQIRGFLVWVAEFLQEQPALTEEEESILDRAYKLLEEKFHVSVPIT
jgi:hypothetical protein